MVAESLVLIALLHIGLLCRALPMGLLPGRRLGGPVPEPLGQVQRGAGAEECFPALEHGELHRAVGPLRPLGLHEVDGGVAYEVGHKQVVGLVVHSEGGVVLLEHAVFNEADLGGQGHGLHLVVGDIDEGRTGLHVEALELIAHLQAQLGVQIGQGLIHEQHRGLGGQGAGDGHPLLLAAGELCGVAVHKHADLHDAGHPADGEVDLLPGELAGLGDHLAPFYQAELPVQLAARRSGGLPGGLHPAPEGGDLSRQVGGLLQAVGEELLGGVDGDGECVHQLQLGLLLVQPAVLVPALLQHPDHLGGLLQDLR